MTSLELLLLLLAINNMLPCYVQHIPAFPLLLHPLEVDANIIDILISDQPIELIVISPPQMRFLSE